MWVAALCVAPARADLRMVGSDLLGLEFSQALYAHAGRQGIKLALAFDGSRSGLEAVRAGRADVALVALPAEDAGALKGLQALPVGYHAVVVLVPAACPLGEITFEQLALAFAAPEIGAGPGVIRWGDLGATGLWATAGVDLRVPEAGGGITADFFRRTVLRGRAWRPSVERYASVAELAPAFGGESRVIALAPAAAPAGTAAKVLRVAAARHGPAIEPTAEALHDGRYPLRLAVQAVFFPARLGEIAPLLGFVLGDAAAPVLARAGVHPLPAAARAEQLREIDLKQKPPR